ncbi:hypothetical protein HYFRA_00012187 [Hymenoscyphus fraxineus]|uniref:Uncharacterized protein n=1 Tax=Hymenoscyphus fraxineus TaxID=746836 RepID=A0A9N9L7N0_9HELO|nr:hypothetical protein HYFRA_00012187 [Hymenoscyphus fraxineus]
MSQTQSQSQSQSGQSQPAPFSHSQDPNCTTIPFAKFSHVTCASGVTSFTWTHVGERDDLNLVFYSVRQFDDNGNRNERLYMKITAGAELLESQDLGDLVRIWKQHDPSKGGDTPIQVVIKCPFLAMRFPKSNTSVRRVQLKFKSDPDFQQALSILTDLGLPVTQNVPSAQSNGRPLVSPAPAMGPPTPTPYSAGNMSSLFSRPGSTNSYNSSSSKATMPANSSSPTKSDFKGPSPGNDSSFPAQGSVARQSYITSSIPRPLSTSALPKNSIYLAQMDKAVHRISSPNMQEPLASGTSQFHQVYHGSEQPTRSFSDSPYFSNRGGMFGPQASTEDPFTSQSFSVPARVQSVPAAQSFDTQRFALPPRRVLPFAKPKPKEKVIPSPPTTAPTKEIESTVPGCATPTRKPAKKRVAQRKPLVTKTQDNENESVTFAAATLDDVPSPLVTNKSTEAVPKAAVTKKRAPVSRPSSASKRPKMVDAATQTQTPSGCDQSVQTIPPPTKEPELVSNVSTPPSPESPPEDYLNGIDKFVSKYSSRSAPTELWQTPGWSNGTEEERDAILNNYICENLENPDFIKLCEDVERSWRRIGLGL